MKRSEWERIWAIFEGALALDDPEQRRSYLDDKCGGNSSIEQEVLSLIDAHVRTSLLDEPERIIPLYHDAAQASSQVTSHSGDGRPAAVNLLPSSQDGNDAQNVRENQKMSGDSAMQIGPYEVLGEIGRGGMGIVYRARDRRLHRVVALKMLPPHLIEDEAAKTRFTTEARAAARLEHPNIATVYDIGEAEDGRLYFAMAYYEGETLDNRIESGPLAIDDAVKILAQMADGLDRAHDAGIVHRDIKPSNILLSNDGNVKILDFGIAKLADLELTGSGQTIGTVAYMSPEQARGLNVDRRSDIWSLGVVLFEMLTCKRPFEGEYSEALLYAIAHARAPRPTSIRPDLPSGFDVVIETALQKEPSNRYETAGDLVRALIASSSAGTSQLRPLAPATPERVRATVLVSHLSGYIELVDQLVPDELEAIIRSFREKAEAVIDAYGGTLHEMDGESLVGLFGIPHVHEDDFVRAVKAAIDLRSAFQEIDEAYRYRTGVSLRIATGIDTGSIVAQTADDGVSMRVSGETLRVAKQLAIYAEADEILVGPDSERLIRPFFETAAHESAAIKGSNRTLIPHLVLGETGSTTRMEAARKEGLTHYAGREQELDALVEVLQRSIDGKGHMVAVVGEAGMGKSRLLHEFGERVPKHIHVLQGRCEAHAQKIPYTPFSGVLRDHLDLPDERIAESTVVERVGAVDPSLDVFLPLYLHLLSLESQRYPIPKHQKGEDLRMAMVEALSGVLTLSAKQRPLVLLLEDWHWSDEASQEVLRQLAELAPNYAMMVVVTFRPEHHSERMLSHATIQLNPLELEPTTAMIRSVVGADEVPDELGRLVHQRTGGNPFFLEEVCRALLEEEVLVIEDDRAVLRRKIESLDLPDTVQAVIRARIHRLGPQARRSLRAASVAGREFSRRLLQAVLPEETDLGEQLDVLSKLGLIQKTAVVPEVTYRFKHALTQEVVYDTLLHHQRKARHLAIGASMEELFAERIEEHLDILVHHFSRAEDWRRAARYSRRAAQRAMRLGQFPEASVILDDATKWLRMVPDEPGQREDYIEVLLELERVCETTGDRSRQQAILDELLAMLQTGGDPSVLAEVHRRQGDLHVLRRRLSEADRSLSAAMEMARASGDADVYRRLLRSLGFLRWNEGKYDEAVSLNEQVLQLHREIRDHRAVIGDLVNLCIIARDEGRYKAARAYLEEARTILDEMENPSVDAYIYHSIGMLYRLSGETEQALAYLEHAATMAEEHRLPLQHSFDLMSMANIYLSVGEIERCIDCYKKAIDLTRRSRYADGLAKSLRVFGQVLAGLERYDEARPYLKESIEWFRQLEDRPSEAETLAQLADLHERDGEIEAAEDAWHRIAELLEALDPVFELSTLEAFGRLARLRDSEAEALSYFHDAIDLAHRLGESEREARLRNVAGILTWNRGDFDNALDQYQKALRIFEELEDDAGIGLMLNSMSSCHYKAGRIEKAVRCAEDALVVHRRAGLREMEAHALALLGDSYLDAGRYGDAHEAFSTSLQQRWDLEDRKGEGWMLLRIAKVHAARGEQKRAHDYAQQALTIAAEVGDRKMLEACNELAME